ncbi:tRNA (adenosine(37)-N6)-threonylcarbamoyltransferase complex transferase subunit TsaD [Hazenella sp. IB182353]|uniref:tRNA (adenosine(37)-N6)-threonylcarbamoyltransferase complex transferase subunit TsaD n=1 Tax=Polycladospora coralii TaxID=2771432 RepID=UPI001746FDD2|nr:tRNA (adenosine(37)-N6)-threonylcarbamoyltransferase complex transferase subunit TsaD [Polycladospora coralii]MBS7531523.1 tRNA (adenosine(37)-N6)-threonylcarbamoyltransferase complex transferase subunit TsaD [Polycladospora coralii]
MKNNNQIRVLGIETSCDETSVAVVEAGTRIRSNIVSSQIDVHQKFGGVVPEVASRRHVERMTIIIEKALAEARIDMQDIDAIAVTQGPGLVGALLIGVTAAKSLSYATGIPLVGVHHIAGHIYANHLIQPLTFPLVALVVSGGHTELIYMEKHNQYQRLGKTRDDAAGEAFDKVARLLNLPYPGGPQIDRLAVHGSPTYDLPRAWLGSNSLDFSFSGLKSAVMNLIHNARQREEELVTANIAASFQQAVLDVLIEKTMLAVKQTGVKNLLLAGGVSANTGLRVGLQKRAADGHIHLHIPPLELCTDNAAMIAAAGTYQYLAKDFAGLDMNAEPNLALIKSLEHP